MNVTSPVVEVNEIAPLELVIGTLMRRRPSDEILILPPSVLLAVPKVLTPDAVTTLRLPPPVKWNSRI